MRRRSGSPQMSQTQFIENNTKAPPGAPCSASNNVYITDVLLETTMAESCLAFAFSFLRFLFRCLFPRQPRTETNGQACQTGGLHSLRREWSRPLSCHGLCLSWSCTLILKSIVDLVRVFLYTRCLGFKGGPVSVYPPLASSPLRPPFSVWGTCSLTAGTHASTWLGSSDGAAVCPLLTLRHRYQCVTIPRSGKKTPNGPKW